MNKFTLLLIILAGPALADGSDHHNNENSAYQVQNQQQAQNQVQNQYADNDQTFSVTNQGGNDTIFVPNNNTENCLRVFGLAIPTKDGAGVIGIPWRSKQCDLEASADDAFAQGNIELGWIFKCKQKSHIKAFGSEEACVARISEFVANDNEMRVEAEKWKRRHEDLRIQREAELKEAAEAKARCTATINRIEERCTK